jgi:hypothetical protein
MHAGADVRVECRLHIERLVPMSNSRIDLAARTFGALILGSMASAWLILLRESGVSPAWHPALVAASKPQLIFGEGMAFYIGSFVYGAVFFGGMSVLRLLNSVVRRRG